jgi:cytochrome c
VVQYVKHLTATREHSGKLVNVRGGRSQRHAAQTGRSPAEPAAGCRNSPWAARCLPENACALCHGETGAGDGTQVPTLKDAAGLPIRPRDFNTGLFRGGHTGRDLYLRINNGLPGTPMIPYGDDQMKPEERWALVHYVQSLRRTDVAVNDLLAPEDSDPIHVHPVAKLPDRPDGQFLGIARSRARAAQSALARAESDLRRRRDPP